MNIIAILMACAIFLIGHSTACTGRPSRTGVFVGVAMMALALVAAVTLAVVP